MLEHIHLFIDSKEEQAEQLQLGIYGLLQSNPALHLHFYMVDVQLKTFRDNTIDRLKQLEFDDDNIPEPPISDPPIVYDAFYSISQQPRFRLILDGPPPDRERTYIKEIFEFLSEQKKIWDIPNEDLILLLTPKGNDLNKFSSFRGLPSPVGFIQTSDWEFFTNTANWYPITYLILETLLKLRGLGGLRESLKYQHKTIRGCFNDVLESKKDFHLKIRIADVCDECLAVMTKKGLSSSLLVAVVNSFDMIRKQSRFIDQHLLQEAPSVVRINEEGTLIFRNYEGIVLRLPPIERTVYLFLLKHIEGISRVDFTDYKKELATLYTQFRRQDEATVTAIITKLVDPLENSLQEKISKINRSIKSLLQSEHRYHLYLINNTEGRYVINIDPEKVEWHDRFR